MSPRTLLLCLVTLGVTIPGAASAGGLPFPTLGIDTPFAVRGQPLRFTVASEPGATFSLFLSTQPAETPSGALGTLFLKPGTLIPLGGGTIGPGGNGFRQIVIPAVLPPGRVFYAQVRVDQGVDSRFSNAVAFRIETAPPAGRRVTQAVAATPDGTKAYVVHQQDGSISVIDAVNDVVLTELPITPPAGGIVHRAVDVAVDPEGRHAFVVNAAASRIAVIDTATDSVAGQIPVPRGSRRVDFDFGASKRVYVTNEVLNAVLVIEENPDGVFTRLPSIFLTGRMPGPLLVLPDGRLMVGQRSTQTVEVLDPEAPPGNRTVAITPLDGLPFDLVLGNNEVLIPSFVKSPAPGVEGVNRVLRMNLTDFQLAGHLFQDVGTDYIDVDVAGSLMAVIGASTGTAIIGDTPTGAQLANLELAPGQPTATPQDSAFVAGPGGLPAKLYVANYFRESLRVIEVAAGPPFTLGAEIALAWSGQPRVPLSGALSVEEDGDWFFRSVNTFGASALSPNRVTCSSCHTDGGTDNITRNRQVPPGWLLGNTGPWGWEGDKPDLLPVIIGALNRHNSTGAANFPGVEQFVLAYVEGLAPPPSVFLQADGSLSADAQAGKVLFEDVAQCTSCHAAPLFLPPFPNPRTIDAGIGTGLVPANVPGLRGAWATAPYLHDGSALTLLDVLTKDPTDTHGVLAAPLTGTERRQLVEYVKTL